jgi:von Willebrand factor type A domain
MKDTIWTRLGRALGAIACCAAIAWLMTSCKLKADDDLDLNDRKDIDDAIEEARQTVNETEICPGYTAAELLMADALSQECRDALLSFLPQPQNDFKGRLVAPGAARVDGDEVRVLLQGADAEGAALAAVDLGAELEVTAVFETEERALAAADFELVATAGLPTDLLSISVVNDYSASMFDRDLDDVEELERDLFECLPAVHETQVLRFSETVQRAVDFTTDNDEIVAALAPDPDFDRSSTALFDAAGTAAGALGARDRPVKLLLLSTDGRENASKEFMEAELLDAFDDHQVFVVVFGALLADVKQLRKLAEGRGVFFYTREFKSLAAAARPFCDALAGLVELRIPEAAVGASSLRLRAGELELRLTL